MDEMDAQTYHDLFVEGRWYWLPTGCRARAHRSGGWWLLVCSGEEGSYHLYRVELDGPLSRVPVTHPSSAPVHTGFSVPDVQPADPPAS